ncbi:MAG: type II toxin-antitoxin system RelB/DinJ family antitoxin [Crocosphaera sp.]|nr:type II toxin-antitoxin system RelB/DinJ family antitoxin [Crocosphaera sp.]
MSIIKADIESQLKASAEAIFKELGLTTSEAITLFYQQVSLQKDLTFLVNIPNEITETTFNKTDNQEELVICESADDMFNKLSIYSWS